MVRSIVHSRLLDRITAPAYRSLATIEGSTRTRSASGAVVDVWDALPGMAGIPASVSAMIYTRSGEREQSQLTSQETTHRIALAGSYPGLTPSMRIRISGPNAGLYDIVRPDRDSQGVTTVLEARIGTPTAQAGV